MGLFFVIATGFVAGLFVLTLDGFLEILNTTYSIDLSNVLGLGFNPCVNPEMFSRTRLDIATIGLAIFSGLAAGIIISKGQSVSVVGVAIAASLAPPAANIGVVLSSGYVILSLMGLGWLLANIFLINICISIVLWAVGVAGGSGISGRIRGAVIKTNIIWIVFFTLFTLVLFVLVWIIPEYIGTGCPVS